MGIDYEDFIQEFQSRPDHTMPVRVMSFMALLWQVLILTGVIVPSDSLPRIIPIVLYNGEQPWHVPCDIKETILMPVRSVVSLTFARSFYNNRIFRTPAQAIAISSIVLDPNSG